MSELKGHNSRELHGIWLVIELGQGIKPTNIATKFHDDPLKNILKNRVHNVNYDQKQNQN